MAGEILKSEGICLDIRGWSKTSHVVSWLTPEGRVATVVKGAVRPKSAFLGQYDLNYTCEILYYARARGELHALRECSPLALRERLRDDYRALALSAHYRLLASRMCPAGPDARGFYRLLSTSLDALEEPGDELRKLLVYELGVLSLAGIAPDFSGYGRTAEWSPFSVEEGRFADSGRVVRVSRAAAEALAGGLRGEIGPQILLECCRVFGVYYAFHTEERLETRRLVLKLIAKTHIGES